MIKVNMETKDGVILNTNRKYCEDYIQITPSNADAISAQNIKEGIIILGVTGTLKSSNANQLISGEITTLNIPNNTTKIRDSAFDGCSKLTSITIPNSVTSIGEYAFYRCNNLNDIIIPSSVTSIGDSAFNSCTGLPSITLNDGIINIGTCAFENCTSLTSITIPDSVTNIGNDMFNGCSNLTSLTIPFYNPSIFGTDSYTNSTNCNGYYIPNTLESITLTNSKTIENNLFKDYKMLKNITLNDGITSIGNNAFRECSNLTSITIPDNVTNIGNSAFENCKSLKHIDIPNTVTSIGNFTFNGCTSLTTITVDPNNTKYCSVDGILYNNDCTELLCYPAGKTNNSFIIPNTVTSIGVNTFSNCSSLTSITIPDSVITIRIGVFAGCTSLASINIPDTVTSIGNFAFNNCYSLTSITIPDSITSIGDRVFNGCSRLIDVTIENGFNANNLDLSVSTKYTHDTILSWLNALYDRTGLDAYRFIIGSTNLQKLTDEEKAIATNKNWTLT